MKYYFSVVEEGVQNPKFQWGRGGRIEVHEEGKQYAIYEVSFFLPAEFFDAFREVFDMKSSDRMPFIRWNYPTKDEEEVK